jgi:hypothetical protein
MRKLLITILATFFVFNYFGFGSTFVGLGGTYSMPQGDFDKTNSSSPGFLLNIESRSICELWYGLRLEYISYDKKESPPVNMPVFENIVSLSPHIRYNFFAKETLDGVFIPYIQAFLHFSSIGANDEKNKLGMGAALGAGITYSLCAAKRCFSFDLGANYSSPNGFFRADTRPGLQSINISLIISVGL